MKFDCIVNKLTPCALVLYAAPIVFLFCPNGIPFLYAGCASGSVKQTGTGEETSSKTDCTEGETTYIDTIDKNHVPSDTSCTFIGKVLLTMGPSQVLCWTRHICGLPEFVYSQCAFCESDVHGPLSNPTWVEKMIQSDKSSDGMGVVLWKKDVGPDCSAMNYFFCDDQFNIDEVVFSATAICD